MQLSPNLESPFLLTPLKSAMLPEKLRPMSPAREYAEQDHLLNG